MNARIASFVVILASGLLVLWITPRWIELGFDTGGQVALRPPPQATGEAVAVSPGCEDAVRELSAVPHPPIVAGGRVRAAAVNGVPIATCIFQTHGACIDVMDFYLSQLAAHGWRDVSDEHFGPPDGVVHDDADAAKYDALRSTHAMLVKKGSTIAIALNPASLGRCSVNITCAGTGDLFGFWQRAFEKSEAVERMEGAHAWLDSREPRSGGTSATRFYSGRGSPDDLIAGIASDMRKEGWNPVLTPRDHKPGVKACMFIKPGGYWAFATARQDSRSGVSRGVLYVQ